MAKITITTDDGEVITTLSDEDRRIGVATLDIDRESLADDIFRSVKVARTKDQRAPNTGAKDVP